MEGIGVGAGFQAITLSGSMGRDAAGFTGALVNELNPWRGELPLLMLLLVLGI